MEAFTMSSFIYVVTDSAPGWTLYGSEQTNNAQCVADKLSRYRFNGSEHITKEAMAGIVANMTWESGLNPGQWEIGYNYDPNSGFGLAQWTPSTKISNYIGSTDPDLMADGDMQVDYLLDTPAQWSTTYVDMNTGYSAYYDVTVPILPTMEDYFRSTDSPEDLAVAWMVYWERGNALYAHFTERRQYADYWYNNLDYSYVPIWLLAKAADNWRMK